MTLFPLADYSLVSAVRLQKWANEGYKGMILRSTQAHQANESEVTER